MILLWVAMALRWRARRARLLAAGAPLGPAVAMPLGLRWLLWLRRWPFGR